MKTNATRLIALLMTLVSLMTLLPCVAMAATSYSCDMKRTIDVTTSAYLGDCKLQIVQDAGAAVFKTKDGKKTYTCGAYSTLKIVTSKWGNGKKATYTLSSGSVTLKFNWASAYSVTVTPKNPASIYRNGTTYYFDHWLSLPVWRTGTQKGIICAY